jgi:hypothetical protein
MNYDYQELRSEMIMLSNTLNMMGGSRELNLSKTALETATMWAGTYLRKAGSPDPYDPAKREDGKIQPRFDTNTATLSAELLGTSSLQQTDAVRKVMAEMLEGFHAAQVDMDSVQEREKNLTPLELMETSMCLLNIYTRLSEARMWLGMELGRIRDITS